MASQLVATEELHVSAEIAFARICSIKTWPVWLSFVKRAELEDPGNTLTHQSDIVLLSELFDGKEEVFEVEELIEPYLLTLVGAFSCRRRIQFRVERKDDISRLIVKIAYPSYGNLIGRYTERFMFRRKMQTVLTESLQTFKGLVEHDAIEREDRAAALLPY